MPDGAQNVSTARRQNVLLAIFIIVILGIAAVWFFFIRQPSGEVVVARDQAVTPSGVAEEVLRAVEILKNIKLDTLLFEDPRFLRFEEAARSVELVTPTGRINPFLPF